jgi:hypothetical protein
MRTPSIIAIHLPLLLRRLRALGGRLRARAGCRPRAPGWPGRRLGPASARRAAGSRAAQAARLVRGGGAAYDVLDRLPLSPAHGPLRKPLLALALCSGRIAAALTSPPFAAALVSAAAAAAAVMGADGAGSGPATNGARSGQAAMRATVVADAASEAATEPGPGLVAMWPRITREHS